MKYMKKSYPLLPFALLFLLLSCSSTQFSSVWKDETYQGQPQKIMVVAISRGLADRRLFEDEFVRDVQKRGAEAIASYPVLQDPTSADRKTIDEQAEGLGADAVLTSRVTGLEAKDEEFPWASYENIYINIETNLYAVKTHRLIWTATTKTWQRQDMSNEYGIRSVVRSITKKISQQGLLKPEPPETADKEGAKK